MVQLVTKIIEAKKKGESLDEFSVYRQPVQVDEKI